MLLTNNIYLIVLGIGFVLTVLSSVYLSVYFIQIPLVSFLGFTYNYCLCNQIVVIYMNCPRYYQIASRFDNVIYDFIFFFISIICNIIFINIYTLLIKENFLIDYMLKLQAVNFNVLFIIIITKMILLYFLNKKSRQNRSECVICCDTISDNILKLNNCNHIFHKDCIYKWIHYNRTCPLCRANI